MTNEDIIKELTRMRKNFDSNSVYGSYCIDCLDMAIEALKAQPEIIHCKECKYAHMTYDGDCKYCDVWFPDESKYVGGDYYCASAERKTDE